ICEMTYAQNGRHDDRNRNHESAHCGERRSVAGSKPRRTGNNQVIGSTVTQRLRGSEMINPVINARATSAHAPSMTSLRGDGRRTTAASPVSSGATAMMPTKSDANQCCQLSSIGADGPRINL